MDRARFDALTRLLATSGSRRATLGALLGALVGPAAAEAARQRRRERGKDGERDRSRDRDREQRLHAEARGKGRKRRKKKRGGRGNGGPSEPPRAECCGTESCPAPEPGSTSSGCNFAGRSFAGQDHNGSLFRRIDGREANFDNTDNRGSVFAEACLHGASFRGANLGGSTWGDACLVDADFTGADLGGDSATFGGAVFCRTTMPDGTVNDRDCGTASRCCRTCAGDDECCSDAQCTDPERPRCRSGQCVPREGAGDCPLEVCQDAFRDPFGFCVYTDSPDNQPGPGCTAPGRVCCQGTCCPAGTACANGVCLCGTVSCPGGTVCANGACVCNAQSCPNGCCSNGPGQPGTCLPGDTNQNCGTGGAICGGCASENVCVGQRCVCNAQSCPDGCCANGPGQPGFCQNFDSACGRNGEPCVDCQANANACVDGICVCNGDSCGGCCSNGSGNPGTCEPPSDTACGRFGAQCVACPAGYACANGACVCVAASCPTGWCANGPGQPGACHASSDFTCGVNGAQCADCGDNQNACVNGACVCNAASCAGLNCCSSGPGNPGTCHPRTNDTCGINGAQCVVCEERDQICDSNGQCIEPGVAEHDGLASGAAVAQRPVPGARNRPEVVEQTQLVA